MFKLVVLLSVAAMAAAKPGVLVPATYSAVVPAAYSSVVPGVSSVSQYSSEVVHGSPAVYSVPTVYNAPTVYNVPAVYNSPALVPVAQAPNSPAVVLDAVNGVPLDTPEVVAARAAHYTAKALAPYHHLRKRSVVGVAPVAYSSVVSPVAYSSPVVGPVSYSSPYVSAPVVSAYSSPVVTSPIAYSSVYPRALSVHPY